MDAPAELELPPGCPGHPGEPIKKVAAARRGAARRRSPWLSGLAFLAVVVVVMATLLVAGRVLALWALPSCSSEGCGWCVGRRCPPGAPGRPPQRAQLSPCVERRRTRRRLADQVEGSRRLPTAVYARVPTSSFVRQPPRRADGHRTDGRRGRG